MKHPATPTAHQLAEFRGLDTRGQLQALRGLKIERTFTVDRNAEVDKEKRTCWFSIASDAPYERWWGIEILDMGKKSIRDQRLKNGLSFCVDHDTRDIVGKAFEYEISAAKKLRLHVRFGRSARAEEVWQDVLDDIRTDTSVGYVIHDLVLESEKDGIRTYRVIDWEPLEGSLVAVPADPTVGLGRSHTTHNPLITLPSLKGNVHMDHLNDNPAAIIPDSASKRVLDLLKLGDEYKDPELARELIANPAATIADFNRLKLEKMRRAPAPMALAEPAYGPSYGSAAREILAAPKYFTGPDAQEKAYRAGQWVRAWYGNEDAKSWCRGHGIEVRAMSGQQLSLGGALVPDELAGAIIDLSDSYGVFRQHADVWPMSSDGLTIPKSSGDPTTGFVAESGALNESEGSWATVNLTTKKLGTIVRVPAELMEDAVINVADRVAFQLARAFSKKEDECGFLGDGTSTYGGITGLTTKLIDGTHDASKVTAATNHDLFSEIDATDLSNLIAALPEYAVDGAKWYCSNLAWSTVFMRLMMAAGGNSVTDLSGKVRKSYAGFEVVTSPTLPAGAATDYTGLVMIMFGNLRLSSKFGSRRDIRIKLLTERYADYDQVGIQATERFDIVNHDLGSQTVAGPMVGLVGA